MVNIGHVLSKVMLMVCEGKKIHITMKLSLFRQKLEWYVLLWYPMEIFQTVHVIG